MKSIEVRTESDHRNRDPPLLTSFAVRSFAGALSCTSSPYIFASVEVA